MKNLYSKTVLSTFAMLLFSIISFGQTTDFTYQGNLKNGAVAANGNHDFQFTLFDAVTGGTQIGPLISGNGVPVTDGVFGIRLDFGNVFPGASRFLQISVRPTGGGAFTPLTPRQPISSAPYSVKSLNAENATTATNSLQLGGVLANQYVLTTADIINAGTQYNIGGDRILSLPGSGNLFVGSLAGPANPSGFSNSFFGFSAGNTNTSGNLNSFFGLRAGQFNVSGSGNSFFGAFSAQNSKGTNNSFFGAVSGGDNTTGNSNTFIGQGAGNNNTIGADNTAIGRTSGFGANNLTFATAIGSEAIAGLSNSIYLGRPGGEDTVRIPGATIINGSLVVDTLGGTTGNVHLCRNTSNRLSLCTTNFADSPELESLRKELQDQKRLTDAQQKQNDELRKQVEALKAAVCSIKADAEICNTKEK